jgi:hypothetical protein
MRKTTTAAGYKISENEWESARKYNEGSCNPGDNVHRGLRTAGWIIPPTGCVGVSVITPLEEMATGIPTEPLANMDRGRRNKEKTQSRR